ncbi:MAG: DUF1173 family protein [Pseudomonas chlororaphis]
MFNTKVTLPTGETLCMQGSDGKTSAAFQKALEKAHPRVKEKPIECSCKATPKVHLTIRKTTRANGTTWFHIVRFADSASNHIGCFFYKPEKNKCGLNGYTNEVISDTENGVKVALDYPLVWKAGAGGNAPRRQSPLIPTRPSSSRLKSMSALGFLNLLWERAGLNSWSPQLSGSRNDYRVINLLHRTAETITVGSHALSDHFLALPERPGDWEKNRLNELHKNQANPKDSHERRLSVIVTLLDNVEDYKLVCTSAKKLKLTLKIELVLADSLKVPGGISAQALTAANLYQQALDAYREQARKQPRNQQKPSETQTALESKSEEFEQAKKNWDRSPKAIVCCLAYLKPISNGYINAEVLDAAIMPVTADWIPYASSYERLIAEMLVEKERTFRKPLRYDASLHTVFPDFELLDTTPNPYPMEVFGRSDEKYEARKAEKIIYYNAEYSTENWWYWIANGEGKHLQIPPLP